MDSKRNIELYTLSPKGRTCPARLWNKSWCKGSAAGTHLSVIPLIPCSMLPLITERVLGRRAYTAKICSTRCTTRLLLVTLLFPPPHARLDYAPRSTF